MFQRESPGRCEQDGFDGRRYPEDPLRTEDSNACLVSYGFYNGKEDEP